MDINAVYTDNSFNIFMYKSSRKNARTSDLIITYHLIKRGEDKKVSDERILQQLINTVEKVVYQAKIYSKHLELTTTLTLNSTAKYRNANNEDYMTQVTTQYRVADRKQYSSIELVISDVIAWYRLIYPYMTLHSKEVFTNPSIKNLINDFYHGKGVL